MPSSKDIRSTFRLSFETPGADAAKKKIEGINDALTSKKTRSETDKLSKARQKGLEREMRLFERKQQAEDRAHRKTVERIHREEQIRNRMVERFRMKHQAADERHSMQADRARERQRQRDDMHEERRQRKEEKIRKSAPDFFRGVLQGAGLGDFYPQDDRRSMLKQTAGNVVGSAARGVASRGLQVYSGLRSMPFTGVQGLQTAAMGIPFAGGVLAAAIQQGQGAATKNLEFQRSMIPLGGFMGARGFGDLSRAGAAGSAAKAAMLARGISEADVDAAGGFGRPNKLPAGMAGSPGSMQMDRMRAFFEGKGGAALDSMSGVVPGKTRAVSRSGVRKKLEADLARRAEDEEARVSGSINPFSRLASAGLHFGGMDATQSNQFGLQFLQHAGGTLPEAFKGGLLKKAIAAQTVFGAGPETTGAFGRGARRGGIVGGDGRGGQALEEAIKDGMAAGMDTTEVRDFLEQIAQAQQKFLQTGIPVNPRSLAMLAGTVAGAGLGVGRGSAIGSAFAGRAQQISQQGPQSAADFLMLQKIGKFGGGGLEGLEDAMGRMENLKNLSPEDFMDFVKSVSQGAGGGVGGRFSLRSVFGQIGAPLGVDESKMLQSGAEGGTLTAEQRDRIASIQSQLASGQASAGGFSLSGAAKNSLGLAPGVSEQAGIENLLTFAGGKILPALQKLEESQANSVRAFTELAPTLGVLSDSAFAVSEELPAIAKNLQRFLDWMVTKFGDPNVTTGIGK